MFERSDASFSHLRRFIAAARRRRRASGPAALIGEAAIQLLTPPLRDAIDSRPRDSRALHLTYAAACVMAADLLAQRFPRLCWRDTAAASIRRIAERGGIDEAQLVEGAERVTATLTDQQPQAYVALCRGLDAAIDRAIFDGERAQGEVLVRLVLERLEAAVQAVIGSQADVVKDHGLLAVVRIGHVKPWPKADLTPPAPRRRGRKAKPPAPAIAAPLPGLEAAA